MPMPTKFSTDTRKRVLAALSIGASRKTAAASAGVAASTLLRWLEIGKDGDEEGQYAKFYAAVLEAEAMPNLKALRAVNNALLDKPELAMKYLERREEGFAPPMPVSAAANPGAVVIQLAFAGGQLAPALGSSTDVEVIDVENVSSIEAQTSEA